MHYIWDSITKYECLNHLNGQALGSWDNKTAVAFFERVAKSTMLIGIRANQLPNSHQTVTICHTKACWHAASGLFLFNNAHFAAALSPYLYLCNPHISFS